jgi:hypothetical protein
MALAFQVFVVWIMRAIARVSWDALTPSTAILFGERAPVNGEAVVTDQHSLR